LRFLIERSEMRQDVRSTFYLIRALVFSFFAAQNKLMPF